MKFKTRLRVTFISIILLPLLLTIMAYMIIGIYMSNVKLDGKLQTLDSSNLPSSMQDFVDVTDRVYDEIKQQVAENADLLLEEQYLDQMNNEVARQSTYLIVRREDELIYAGDNAAYKMIEKLPKYGTGNLGEDSGYYFKEQERYVKQIDFTFSDGSRGSVFVVTKLTTLISKEFLLCMLIAIVLILIFTSCMLTQWIHKGVFTPVTELNIAMQKIKDGNFDYILTTEEKGEIGDLYRNYEDMRLRLKESTEEKEAQEKQHKELISNISHDLKTPITAIKGYVEGIMDGVADTPEKMDKYIKTIYNKANDMDKLINELTVYSGFDNNRIPYNFHRINVADYFGDCVEEVGLDLESKNIQLNYSNMADPDTMVIADPEQMKKVINNIISNSVKYMDKLHGQIDIRILDEVDSIRVEIEDNGKGIEQKDLQRIFDRFYRTDTSRNSAQGGSGIGLSIVRKIIEDHGGYVWATSKEGEGTCMHFVLRKYIELQPKES